MVSSVTGDPEVTPDHMVWHLPWSIRLTPVLIRILIQDASEKAEEKWDNAIIVGLRTQRKSKVAEEYFYTPFNWGIQPDTKTK